MVGTRDTPKDLQSGPLGFEPGSVSNFIDDGESEDELDMDTAKKLAQEAYHSSTNWLNSGRRAKWNDNNRAFLSLHPTGSKYLSRDYSYRSSLYRPKTRATIRKAEAQTAAAFFSNEDVVSIQAQDDDDPKQQASAKLMQALLQHRLTVGQAEGGIPWFLTLVGGRQDAEIMGIAVAHAYWKFEERYSHTMRQPKLDPQTQMPSTSPDGTPQYEDQDFYETIEDKPQVDLIAPENIRFEPGCDWRDVVNTSPYLIQLVPMYIQDIKAKVESGEWLSVSESAMRSANDMDDDVTRRARETGRVPGKDHDSWKPMDYDIGWCRRNIIKWGGEDWTYWTLGSAGEMLSKPRRLKEVELHGKRPYVVGFVVLETHKTYPSGKPELVRDLQRAANDDWNMRFDQLKLSLNPRQFVKTSAGIEVSDARTFMPGKVVLTKDPQTDIVWDRPPEPSQAAYAEQDRINMDFDDLVGDFSNSSVQASQIQQQSATGMHLMSGQASGMNEYELRVFGESFVEPLIRLLVKLEQAYETDPVILAIAGKNAQLIQKFGMNEITDELLQQELTVRVNVGIGATNPQLRLRNFMMGSQIIGNIYGPTAAQGTNFEEVASEVFGLLGYKDGKRFFQPNFDPRVQQLQQELQKLQGQQGKGAQPDPYKLQAAQIQAQSRTQDARLKTSADITMAQLDYRSRMEEEQNENWRMMFKAGHEHAMQGIGHLHERGMAQQGHVHDMGMAGADQMHQRTMQANEPGPAGKDQFPPVAQSEDGAPPQTMLQGGLGGSPSGAGQGPSPSPPLQSGGGGAIVPHSTQQPQMQPEQPLMPQHVLMASEAIKREAMLHQAAGQFQDGMQQMLQIFAQTMSQVVQSVQQGNEAIQQGNAELVNMVGFVAQRQEEAAAQSMQQFAAIAQQIEQSNVALGKALTAPKRVVRDRDGRATGTETVMH